MTDRGKLGLWSLGGIAVCLLLIPTITEAGGMQVYLNLAAFMLIYFGGVLGCALLLWLWKRWKSDKKTVVLHSLLTSSKAMVAVMIGFGFFWYDFSEARPHSYWTDYSYAYLPPTALEDGWGVATAKSENVDQSLIEAIVDRFVNDPEYKWQHSFLLVKNNKLIVEEYFYDQTAETNHDLRSANKSITSILIGAAIKQGFIGSEKDPAARYFPEYNDLFAANPKKAAITIEHLLTMQSGLDANDWDSSSPGN